MARSFQLDAALLTMSRSTIAESRRLLAASWSERVSLNNKHDFLLANSRASIADSRRLLAAVEAAAAATHRDEARRESIAMPVATRAGTDAAALSIHVFQEERGLAGPFAVQAKRCSGGERPRPKSRHAQMHSAPK
jgi:hypothetical protein